MGAKDRLERKVAALGDLPGDEPADRWMKSFRCLPLKGPKRGLIERAFAWQLPAMMWGRRIEDTASPAA